MKGHLWLFKLFLSKKVQRKTNGYSHIHEEECVLTFCTKIFLKILNIPSKKFYQ